jgi:hypothetical protein
LPVEQYQDNRAFGSGKLDMVIGGELISGHRA